MERNWEFVNNAILKVVKQTEDTSHIKERLEEYKDRFEGIGEVTGIKVDLNDDLDFKPVAEPPRRQPFSVRDWKKKYNTFWTKYHWKS